MRTNSSFKFELGRVAPREKRAALAAIWLAVLLQTTAVATSGEPSSFEGFLPSSPFAPISGRVTPDCRRDSMAYLTSLRDSAGWSLDMFSSSTNIKEGLETVAFNKMGDFDRCIQAAAPKSLHGFRGQYCTASVSLSAIGGENVTPSSLEPGKLHLARTMAKAASGRVPFSWAFCVPSSCSASDVAMSLDDVLIGALAPLGVNATALVHPGQCKASTVESPLSGADIAMVVVLTFFGLVAISSTCYDIFAQKRLGNVEGRTGVILSSFSLMTNGRKLLIGNAGESVMGCLHGLRFLSICWIIFGHTFYMSSTLPITNIEYVLQLAKNWTNMVVLNESVAVDTFFLLSGLLLAHVYLRERQQGSNFNFLAFYCHRYIRLTPPYIILIGFYATVFYKIGSGPLWDVYVGKNRDYCLENWWTNLVYVNNYVNIARPCMDQTWYLAVDMQFYWVSPILLLPMWRWRRAAKYLIGVAGTVAVVTPIVITAVERFPAAMFFNDSPENISNVFTYVYTRAYARAGPYIVGIGLGYLFHSLKGKQILIPKRVVALCWAISTASCLAIVFGIYGMMQKDHVYNVVESSLYAGLHRTVWAASLAWVIFACCNGYGGPVNAILSWNALAPLSRLTYSAYLSHYIVVLYYAGTTRTVGYFSPYTVTRDFLGNLMITLAISLVVSLVFESPFMTISKVLLRGGGQKRVAAPGSPSTQLSNPKLYGSTETTLSPSSRAANVDEEAPSSVTEEFDAAVEAVLNVEDEGPATQALPSKHSYENRAFEPVT